MKWLDVVVDGVHVSPVGQSGREVDDAGCGVDVDVDDGWQVSPVGQMVVVVDVVVISDVDVDVGV